MKRLLAFLILVSAFQVTSVFAGKVEDWSAITAANTGTYLDTMGSKIDFSVDNSAGLKAAKLSYTLVQGGYVGIWHNLTADLSKSGALKFKVKSTLPGGAQMALKDAFGVQYIANFTIPSADFTEVTVPFASFSKDSTYQPPGAIPGHPMDVSNTQGMNFAPKTVGTGVMMIALVESSAEGAQKAEAPKKAASTGPAVVIQDWTDISMKDAKSSDSFHDSQGSTFADAIVEIPGTNGRKCLVVNYELKQGGYSGMWCRAGDKTWGGVDLSKADSIDLIVYSKDSIVIGLALKDKAANQYVAETPETQGKGKWERISVPLSSFQLDPYYTPPDAIKGAAKDFSQVKTFNIQPKTTGKFNFAVLNVIAK